MCTSSFAGLGRSLSVAAIFVCWFSTAAAQPNARLLHSYNYAPDRNYDAAAPLITDAEGSLYGATYFGGAASSGRIFEFSLRRTAGRRPCYTASVVATEAFLALPSL
jgi:uncharacterized repeat protein (TIGR03803 family)